MESILSEQALRVVRDRFYAGITNAELGFPYSAADEDSLTGALGQELLTRPTLVQVSDGSAFLLEITYYKIRGRGPNAPETRTGADGIFQLRVQDSNENVIRQKGLLFQAKKQWTGADRNLADQACRLSEAPRDGIVIDYTPHGYNACPAKVVVQAVGNRTQVESREFSRLADMLGNNFVRCRVGVHGLYYDQQKECLVEPSQPDIGAHVIDTRITLDPRFIRPRLWNND